MSGMAERGRQHATGLCSCRHDLRRSVRISQTRFHRTPPSPATWFSGLVCRRLPPQQQLVGAGQHPLDSPETLPWLPVAPEGDSDPQGQETGSQESERKQRTYHQLVHNSSHEGS